MKRLGNVLYILTPDSYLFCENESIAIKIGGEEKARIPAHTIESIICFGMNTVSTPFVRFCGERGIGLTFCSEHGRFYGRFSGPVSGNVLLRKRQYDLYGTKNSVTLARNFIFGKVANEKLVLLRAAREREGEVSSNLRLHAAKLTECIEQIKDAGGIDYLRGIEGKAAAVYFGAFESMQTISDEELLFKCRTKHPPENRMNALLSFLYMLCLNDVRSALESVGLDPAVGYIHSLRPGRSSLALDLMEELRAPLCDRLALSLTNKMQIKASDFVYCSGYFKMSDKARRIVIDAWQSRKKDTIYHRFFKEKIHIGLIPYAQAMLLARYIRGDLDSYPPFIWR